mgnify:CR=1 FL=1
MSDLPFRAAFGRPFFVPVSLDAACPARYAHASDIPQETGMDLRKILLISLGHLSCDLNGGALPSLMPYLAAAHGFNYQAAGALMFAYSATSSLVQPVFGYLADKHARSWFVPLAVLLAGGSLGLVGFLDSYWAIFLTLMLCGVGGALFHPEGARYANLVSGSRKGAGMSIFSVGGNSGFVVGPLLVAGATCVAGLHGTAVFLLLALCTASFLFVQMRGWQQGMPRGRTAAGQAEPRNDWHAFGVLTLVIASRSILFLGFNTYIPLYWHDVFGQSKEFGAMMLAFFCVCGVSSNVLGGFLADRIGYARIIRLSWWLALPAALAFAWADSMWLAALLLAGCAAPQAVQAPAPQQTAKAAETQSGVTFTDAMGYPVTVQSWNRVVSLYGSFAEAWTLAGGTLTATTEDAIKERGLDLGTDIAVIGTNQDPNTEEILAQNSDFVILNAEVSEQTALHEFLQEAGVPHAYFKTNTFDEYLAMLRTFCDMTGREDLYEQNGLAVQQQISDVLELVQNAKLPAPNVLLLRAYSSGCKAKGSDNMTGAMLKDLGVINIADADDSLLENLSMENIIADDPEDIFVVTMGASQQKALDWLAENLQANPAWSGLSAVQSGHYYLLDKALFHYKPNARWGESYRTLAALLYPQLADQLEALA